jgi:hypothetical protein
MHWPLAQSLQDFKYETWAGNLKVLRTVLLTLKSNARRWFIVVKRGATTLLTIQAISFKVDN